MADVRSHFRPEFLNRIDETVIFSRLDAGSCGRSSTSSSTVSGGGSPTATSPSRSATRRWTGWPSSASTRSTGPGR
jgi:hypothetical protein